MSDLHVVLGTGPVGQRTASALAADGLRVRAVNRSGSRPEFLAPNVEIVAVADASDAAQLASAVEGASVVYQCLNPPYDKWAELFPPLQRAVIAAATRAGARLVVMENLYALGHVVGPMTEDAPLHPNSRKGAVRAQMTEELLEVSSRGELTVAIGRASDYYGPGALNSAIGMVFPALVAGKKVSMIGSVDRPHSYAYIEDIGRGLATLGTHAEAFGQVWNLPHAPAKTARQSLAPAFAAAGKSERIGAMSALTLRIGGLFIPAARESVEMVYEFTEPFVVDSSKIERAFGLTPTPLVEGMRRTLTWMAARAKS
jgi:nucleoside-diphosphate-sugar epimerase